MSSWLQDNPILGVLSALTILLAIVIGVEGEFGASVGSVIRPGAASRAVATDAKLLPPIIAIAPEVAYPETTTRPVFTPTRRPAPEAPPAAAQPTFQKGQFVLQGVIVVGNSRVAMLREKSSGRIIRIERGREVNGITVVEIQPETVTLSLGSEEEKLSLSVQKPAPGLPAAPAAPAAAAPQGGPFASTAPAVAPGTAAPPSPPGAAQPAPPAAVFPPFARPAGVAQPAGTPNPNPAARATTDAAAAPMTPEELLERRRARRTPQNQ